MFLDGSVKGCFDSLSSCTGHLVLLLQNRSMLNDFFSLKKKELFNIKEAHNHSFSHAVCGFARLPCPLLTVLRLRTGDGITIDLNLSALELTWPKGPVCAQGRSVLYQEHCQGQ